MFMLDKMQLCWWLWEERKAFPIHIHFHAFHCVLHILSLYFFDVKDNNSEMGKYRSEKLFSNTYYLPKNYTTWSGNYNLLHIYYCPQFIRQTEFLWTWGCTKYILLPIVELARLNVNHGGYVFILIFINFVILFFTHQLIRKQMNQIVCRRQYEKTIMLSSYILIQ